jgi:hypothetical protein
MTSTLQVLDKLPSATYDTAAAPKNYSVDLDFANAAAFCGVPNKAPLHQQARNTKNRVTMKEVLFALIALAIVDIAKPALAQARCTHPYNPYSYYTYSPYRYYPPGPTRRYPCSRYYHNRYAPHPWYYYD